MGYPVKENCWKAVISQGIYFKWKTSTLPPDMRWLKQLNENTKPKKLFAELYLDREMLHMASSAESFEV